VSEDEKAVQQWYTPEKVFPTVPSVEIRTSHEALVIHPGEVLVVLYKNPIPDWEASAMRQALLDVGLAPDQFLFLGGAEAMTKIRRDGPAA
jgi:hypothetical protein